MYIRVLLPAFFSDLCQCVASWTERNPNPLLSQSDFHAERPTVGTVIVVLLPVVVRYIECR